MQYKRDKVVHFEVFRSGTSFRLTFRTTIRNETIIAGIRIPKLQSLEMINNFGNISRKQHLSKVWFPSLFTACIFKWLHRNVLYWCTKLNEGLPNVVQDHWKLIILAEHFKKMRNLRPWPPGKDKCCQMDAFQGMHFLLSVFPLGIPASLFSRLKMETLAFLWRRENEQLWFRIKVSKLDTHLVKMD